MVRDITIGQYYNTRSPIHELDARTKLVLTIVYAVTIFWCRDLWTFLAATAFLIVYVALSRVPLSFICRGLKVVWAFILFTAFFSLFNGDGRVLVSIWRFHITSGSLNTTGTVVFRFVYLIIGSSIMTYTTLPLALTAGLEKLFGFLKIFRVPVSDMALMLSITLRFIPILMEELDKIMKAQLSRGADFENGNVFKRIRSYTQIFIPLFASAIRRATDLAYAMDARCYHGSECRTSMKPLRYSKKDAFAYGLLVVYVVGLILMKIYL